MKILGINISHHSSSCLLVDNEIKFLLEDERVSRIKGYCPGQDDLERFVDGEYEIYFAEELFKHTTHLDYIIFSSYDRNMRVPEVGDFDDLVIENYVRSMKNKGITWDEIVFQKENHHIYHACSGFYGSEFDEAVALVLDGGGSIYENEEDVVDLLGRNTGNWFRELETIFKVDYKSGVQPLWKHYGWTEAGIRGRDVRNDDFFCEKYGDNVVSHTFSNGCLFNIFSVDLGFKDGDDSGKVMGMSSFHSEKEYYFYDLYPEEDPRWWRKIEWFEEMNGVWITTKELRDNLGTANNYPFERKSFELNDFMVKADIANKLQEESLKHTKRLITKAVEISGCKNVVLSGGYALNCLNNYQYLDIDPEINLYVDPVCYDAGTALGAAKWLYYKLTKSTEKNPLTSLYLS